MINSHQQPNQQPQHNSPLNLTTLNSSSLSAGPLSTIAATSATTNSSQLLGNSAKNVPFLLQQQQQQIQQLQQQNPTQWLSPSASLSATTIIPKIPSTPSPPQQQQQQSQQQQLHHLYASNNSPTPVAISSHLHHPLLFDNQPNLTSNNSNLINNNYLHFDEQSLRIGFSHHQHQQQQHSETFSPSQQQQQQFYLSKTDHHQHPIDQQQQQHRYLATMNHSQLNGIISNNNNNNSIIPNEKIMANSATASPPSPPSAPLSGGSSTSPIASSPVLSTSSSSAILVNSINDSNNNNLLNNNNNNNNNNNLNASNYNSNNMINNNNSSSSSSIVSNVSQSTVLSKHDQQQQYKFMFFPPQWQQQQQQSQHQKLSSSIGHHNSNSHQNQSLSSSAVNGGDATYHFKTLVPAVAAGAIIGKGGETIAALQKETNTRVKMSKSHDFYPGTTERVCLITGSTDAIMNVLDFIMDKIREKPDLTMKLTDIEQKQAQERDKQVKILVPNSTAGMIIGKAGGYIKQIKEESGSYVQISQKPKDVTLQERCITVIGEKEPNKVACKMILQKIVEDPQSGILLNVSYADVSGPVANYNPIGSPYALSQPNSLTVSSSTSSLNSALNSVGTGASLLVNGTVINLSLNLSSPNPTPTNITQPIVDNLKMTMRRYGHTEAAANEVSLALTLLAKYGVNITGPHSNGTLAPSSLSYLNLSGVDQTTAAAAVAAATTNSSMFGAIGQGTIGQVSWDSLNGATSPSLHSSMERYEAAFDPFRHAGSQAATPISLTNSTNNSSTNNNSNNNNNSGLNNHSNNNSNSMNNNNSTVMISQNSQNNSNGQNNSTIGLATGGAQSVGGQSALGAVVGALNKSPTPGDIGAKDSKKVEIPELIVGAILGPGGRSLTEIQHRSGANIQISSKGIFAPGTKNRIVKISGQPKNLSLAQYLIEQKISEEESKRARQQQAAITGIMQ